MTSVRSDGRGLADLRPVKMELQYLEWAEGSVLLEMGKTRVLAAASYEAKVPRFLVGSGRGWVTAEYAMLPRATETRTPREVGKGRPSGRTQEIQRLVGRSLRGITDMSKLGESTMWIDCDVLQADGGTRCASITGGFVAVELACRRLIADKLGGCTHNLFSIVEFQILLLIKLVAGHNLSYQFIYCGE